MLVAAVEKNKCRLSILELQYIYTGLPVLMTAIAFM